MPRPNDESIEEIVASQVAHIPNADDVASVSRNVEQDLRIAAQTGTTVVALVIEVDDRHAVRWKCCSRRMDFDFVRETVDGMRLGGRAQISQPQASLVEE